MMLIQIRVWVLVLFLQRAGNFLILIIQMIRRDCNNFTRETIFFYDMNMGEIRVISWSTRF